MRSPVEICGIAGFNIATCFLPDVFQTGGARRVKKWEQNKTLQIIDFSFSRPPSLNVDLTT